MKNHFYLNVAALLCLAALPVLTHGQCYQGPSYCIPTSTNVANYNIGLQNVTLGSSVNNTTAATGNSPTYFDYTHLSVSGSPGQVITFSIRNGAGNSTLARLYIDWNNDGTFDTSTSEKVWTSATITANAVVSDSFTIPSGQGQGLYRIRFTGDFGQGASRLPCKTNYGEQEDYSLVVTGSARDGVAKAHVSPVKFSGGSDTIRFSMVNLSDTVMSSVDIGYRLDTNSPVLQSLSGLSVAPGGVYTATFDTLLQLSTAGNYSLKVWLNNLNGSGTVNAADDTICRNFILCTTPLNGSYTIDPNGSGATNFTSFAEATAALTNCGITGPVVFMISADSFYEQISVPLASGVSYTNTITFVGAGTDSTILCYEGTAAAPHTVRIDEGRYISFRNVAIKSSSKTNGWPLHLVNAFNFSLAKSLVTFTDTNTLKSTSSNFACIVINGGATALATQTKSGSTDSLFFDSNTVQGGYYNSYMYLGGGVPNALVRYKGNVMKDAYYSSIYIWLASQVCHKISDNLFTLRTGGNNQFAIWSFATAASNAAMYSEINNNRFTSLNGYGVALTYPGGNGGARGMIYNNLFGGNTRGATRYISGAGAACCAFNGWNIYHNTFYMDCNTGTSMGIDLGGNTNGPNVSIKNNLFYNASTSANNVGINAPTAAAIGKVDFNNFYSAYTNGTYASFGGADYTAANFNADSFPYGCGKNSTNRKVAFVSSTDYHHNTGCLSGEDLGVAADYDGNSRSTPPTIGAYETSGVPATDIGVLNILSPGYPVQAGPQVLSALVKNFGSDSVASATVYYTLNGSTDSETFTFSPSLKQCDTMTVWFTDSINLAAGYNTLKVYTDYSGDTLPTNDTARGNYCAVMAGNYTINPGQAASATNFTSFKAAIDQLACSGINAPVHFAVSANTFTEQVTVPGIQGSSGTNTISFYGAGKDSTKLTYANTSATQPHVLRLSGCQYVSFRNMWIEGSDGTNLWVVSLVNSNNNTIAGCKIACAGQAANAAGSNIAGVVINSSGTAITSGGSNHNNTIDSNEVAGGYYGIASFASNNANINYLRNNAINNSYMSGIYAQNNQCLKVLNNRIENRSANGSSRGIHYINCNAANGGNGTHHEVKGNYINKVGQYGIYFQSVAGGSGSVTSRGELWNNMIGGEFYSTNAVHAIDFSAGYYWYVYHNSIDINSSGSNNAADRGIFIQYTGLRNQVKNNAVAITNKNAANAQCVEIVAGTNTDSLNYNNYYNAAGNNVVTVAGNTYTTSTYKAAYPSGGGDQSQEGDPGYLSSSDLHAGNNQLDNRGDALYVSTDIDDDTRSSTTPDIGADEYFPNARRDFSLNKLLSPSYSFCMGGINQTIAITIKNTGIDTIDLSNDTAWAAVEVTDPNSITTVYGPVAITGAVFYPKDGANIAITTTFDMSELGTYFIKPYIGFHADSNYANDTLFNLSFDATNPVAVMSPVTKTGLCGGDSVKMSVANSKNATEYQWYRNNVAINGAIDTVYYATTAGTYFCDVMVYNGGCAVHSDTITVTSGTTPTATFTAGKTTFCDGDSTILSSPGNAAWSYQWWYNGTALQGATDSLLTVKTAGSYAVMVSETASGCAATSGATAITVNSNPAAAVWFAGNGTICQGDSIRISSNPAAGLGYQWQLNGNNIAGATDSVYYATATGNYAVEISNSNNCTALSGNANIYVDSLPANAVWYTGNLTACGMDTIHMWGVSNSTFTYQWWMDGNSIAGANTSSYAATASGSYVLELTNQNNCKSITGSTVVAFRPVPGIPVHNLPPAQNLCPGEQLRLSVIAVDTGSFTYAWKQNGSSISSTDSFVLVNSGGTFVAEITNNAGCTSSSSGVTVTMFTTPDASITAASSTTICQGDSVSLTASNAASGIASLGWTFNGNTTGGGANPLYAHLAGFYNVHVTDNNGCKDSASAMAIFVNPAPTPVIVPDAAQKELNTQTFNSYQWYRDGVAVSGATSQKLSTPGNGDYTVEVTDANGCKGRSAVYTVSWHIGIEDASRIGVKAYPNPVTSVLTLEWPADLRLTEYRLMDARGRQVYTETNVGNTCTKQLDVSKLSAGVYMLILDTGNGKSLSMKVTKE